MVEKKITPDDVVRRIRRLMLETHNEPQFGKGSFSGTSTSGGSRRDAKSFTNPMSDVGDLIRGGNSGAPARLGVGTAGQVLTVVSGKPAWSAPPGGTPYTDEQVRDVIGAALVAGSGMTITVSDLADTITLDATATAGGQYRQELYTTYAGGDLLYDTGGHLMYTFEDLE